MTDQPESDRVEEIRQAVELHFSVFENEGKGTAHELWHWLRELLDYCAALLKKVEEQDLTEQGFSEQYEEWQKEREAFMGVHQELRAQVEDAEETIDAMRQKAILAPGKQHDPTVCSQSWGEINALWSAYQRRRIKCKV